MRLFALLVLLSLIVPATFLPLPVYASHGMVTLDECSTRVWVADLTKGRTNSIVVHVKHSVEVRPGCTDTYDYTNFVGADREDQLTPRETAWQMAECERTGKQDTVNLFDRGFHQTVNPDDVKVSCRRYVGPD